MNITDKMTQMRADLRTYRRDMQSINPITSTYKKLTLKCALLETELAKIGGQKAERDHKMYATATST